MSQTLDRDNELRSNGLPYVVPFSRWHHDLLWRAAPLLFYAAFTQITTAIAYWGLSVVDATEIGDTLSQLIYVGLFGFMILVPIPLVLHIWRKLNTRSVSSRRFWGLVALISMTLTTGIVTTGLLNDTWETSVGYILGSFALAWFLVWSGLAALARWTVSTAIREIPTITTVGGKMLPIIITVVVFSYFSAEPWQIADSMTGGRLFMFITAFAMIAFITTIGVARAELREDLLTKSPEALPGKANIYMLVILMQLVQGALFLILFTAVLFILGNIAINDKLLTTWLTHAPVNMSFAGKSIPLSLTHLYTSLFVASFAMLSFMVAASTDKEYRKDLFDPIIEKIKTVIRRS